MSSTHSSPPTYEDMLAHVDHVPSAGQMMESSANRTVVLPRSAIDALVRAESRTFSSPTEGLAKELEEVLEANKRALKAGMQDIADGRDPRRYPDFFVIVHESAGALGIEVVPDDYFAVLARGRALDAGVTDVERSHAVRTLAREAYFMALDSGLGIQRSVAG